MIIGTVRQEEAQAYDSHAGYHSFHAEETQEEHGSFEVFFMSAIEIKECHADTAYSNVDWDNTFNPGWYWVACYPGYLPDSESPNGPFAYSQQAHEDADEWSPEYDD
jgi:hypothetical protein|tara:strand:+ start:293 stop:613 length:321 start_codon:yes stop_codon:yes gene_type:complete